MSNLTSPKGLKEIINKYDFKFSKRLGQNFLTDSNILNKIIKVSEIDKSTGIIEVGPGAGVLTQKLAENAGKVVAVELDKKLIPILKETLNEYDNVCVINDDILKVDINSIINNQFDNMKTIKMVANLPYYITTPIIMQLLEKRMNIDSIVVMIQKEVALRMKAAPGGKDYGALSVAVQYFTNPEIITIVPPHCFIPQPKVESAVIKLDVYKKPIVKVKNEKLFFNIIKASFGQRRKTLVNSLFNCGPFTLSKNDIKQILKSIGINEKQRGETLSIIQFTQLANEINDKIV